MIMSLKPHSFYECHTCTGCIKEVGLHIVGATILVLFFLFLFFYPVPWTLLAQSQIVFSDRIWTKRYKVITLASVFELVQSAFYSPFSFQTHDICLQNSKQQKKSFSFWKNIIFCNKAFHPENVMFKNIKAQNDESKQIKSRTEAMSIRR